MMAAYLQCPYECKYAVTVVIAFLLRQTILHNFCQSIGKVTIGSPTPVNFRDSHHQVLLKIATDAAWLLSLPYNSLNLEFIYQRYLYLISQTFPYPTNRAAVNRDLLEMLTIHYGR
ncbi:hypothetical protein [Fischerella sp. PCC 9605]|uniref:hypothetical protein n=1 Tax=Fischerella sp. PCC 9605 TaxID=1173024 RepID=UPI0004B87A15|nr:hypothetical protein [Fischerella sp. PCC 9605]